MTRHFSLLIFWGCSLIMVMVPATLVFFLFNIESFAQFVEIAVDIPIQWQTVVSWQWYCIWGLMIIYLSIGMFGLYYLGKAFKNFAKGEMFNLANSKNLKRFAILLFVQFVTKPIFLSLTSVLLSLNHPAGERLFTVTFGSQDLNRAALAMILWVMSDLLIKGSKLQNENRQFV